jgi:hypothetical protein
MELIEIFRDELEKVAIGGKMLRFSYDPAGDPKAARSMVAKSLVGWRRKWGPAAGRIMLAESRGQQQKLPYIGREQTQKEVARKQYGGLKEWAGWPEVGDDAALINRAYSTPELKQLSPDRRSALLKQMEARSIQKRFEPSQEDVWRRQAKEAAAEAAHQKKMAEIKARFGPK